MGKAKNNYTPEQLPPEDDRNWLSLDAAFERLIERIHYGDLAARDLQDALAQGRLRCMVRSTAAGERKYVVRTTWTEVLMLRFSGKDGLLVMLRPQPGNYTRQFRGVRFYVLRSDLEDIWPTGSARAASEPVDHDDSKEKLPATEPKGKPKSKSEKKRKSYWDDPVDRALRENFPNNSATDFEPKAVMDKVLDVLADKIKTSGREPPSRGLILRKSGHWKR
jgi:hypothetical protein